ncbi:MAG TPA: hypothetical protein VNX01_14720 [Bacteroidia bacterium]|nr:hypothetical protein [Bacteroidia bacterium]
MKKLSILSLLVLVAFASCKKDTKNTTTTPPPAGPQLKFVFKFDSTQNRLNSQGQITNTLTAGHQAQCPHFNGMSAHYIEMTQNNMTAIGAGTVLYTTPTTPCSPVTVWNNIHTISQTYTDAINFNQETVVGDGQQFFSIPLSQVAAGTYPYIRISVAYQNYDIKYGVVAGTTVNIPGGGVYTYTSNVYSTGTIASFIGYNTQIGSYTIKTQTDVVGTDKQQGYWAFESAPIGTYTVPYSKGQAPQGATTVVSPSAFATTAIPPGSCLVTGQFVNQAGATTPLVITGHETSDVVITISMSTNKSFEWIKHSSPTDNYIYPLSGDTVVDMGLRGMMPKLPQ